MKRIVSWILALVLLLGVAAALIWSFLRHRGEGKEQEPEAHAQATHMKTSTNGEVTLSFDAATQERMGLQTATLVSTNVAADVQGYGRVLDPGALAALVNEALGAQATAQASHKEFERVKSLQDQNNASARALQAAEALATRDELLARAAQERLQLAYGEGVTREKDLAAFVEQFVHLKALLVRVDLPAGQTVKSAPTGATLHGLSSSDESIGAEYVGRVPTVDPLTQSEALLFVVRTNALQFAPGSAVTARVQLPGGPLMGVVVPRAAILRAEGKAWVYVQTEPQSFARRPILLDLPLEEGWFTSSLPSGTKVVVVGAQELLSTELVGAQ